MSARVDLRIWGPALVGLLALLPRALPPRVASERVEARAIELPRIYGLPQPTRDQRFELDVEESSIRLRVRGAGGELLAECRGGAGSLELGADPAVGELQLSLDLSSIVVLEESGRAPPGVDLITPEGAVRLTLRSRRVSVATSDLPGVSRDLWRGTVRLDGADARNNELLLWRCALPGQRLRTQGRGTVTLRGAPGEVTLGLDLAWRRRRGR